MAENNNKVREPEKFLEDIKKGNFTAIKIDDLGVVRELIEQDGDELHFVDDRYEEYYKKHTDELGASHIICATKDETGNWIFEEVPKFTHYRRRDYFDLLHQDMLCVEWLTYNEKTKTYEGDDGDGIVSFVEKPDGGEYYVIDAPYGIPPYSHFVRVTDIGKTQIKGSPFAKTTELSENQNESGK